MWNYAIQPSELEILPLEEVFKMHQAIEIFRAQEILEGFKISIYPKLKHSDRQKEHKAQHKKANPSLYEKVVTGVSLKQIAKLLEKGK